MLRRSISLLASVVALSGTACLVTAPMASAATPQPISSQACAYTESGTAAGDACAAAVPAAAPVGQTASASFTIAAPATSTSSTVHAAGSHVHFLRQPGLRRP